MTRRSAPISILLLFCIIPAWAQVKVVDAAKLTGYHTIHFLPDVEGKVVVDAGYLDALKSTSDTTLPVFPGWPVAEDGTNERGGIYANLDDDPELELVYPAGPVLYAFNADGSDVEGWPQQLDYPTDGAPAFGDIDGDGVGEIVVTTHQIATFAMGTVYAFETDGSDVAGFPVTTEGGAVRTPVLADIDGDHADEIIITIRKWPEGFVEVFKGDGTVYPNWPIRMDYVPASAVAVGDIDDDGIPEIVAESYYRLHAYRPDGTILPGFPYKPDTNRVFSYSSPVLADIDGDGKREIICGDHSLVDGSGAVHVVRYNGGVADGWPKFTTSWVYGPPSVGDIDGDGLLDIAVGDQTLSPSPVNKVYAWSAVYGDPLPGFPIENVFGVNSQIILADLDGDNQVELLFDDNTSAGKYEGFNHDGTIMDGWPLMVDGSTFFINPMVVDVYLDGNTAISGGGFDDGSDIINFYLWDAGVEYNSLYAELPILQYNTRHNGVYGDYLMVGMPETQKEVPEDGWRIYPNPANSSLHIFPGLLKSNKKIIINIYQSSGTSIITREFKNPGNNEEIDVSNFPAGIYWIQITDENGINSVLKIVKLP